MKTVDFGVILENMGYKGTKWYGKKKNGLYFNSKELVDGAWICNSSKDSVGIDRCDVDDYLIKRDNIAEI